MYSFTHSLTHALHSNSLTHSHLCYTTQTQGSDQSEFISCHDRNRMVKWLCLLNHDLHYQLEVFFRATNILDQFLSVMKVDWWRSREGERERERERELRGEIVFLLCADYVLSDDITQNSIIFWKLAHYVTHTHTPLFFPFHNVPALSAPCMCIGGWVGLWLVTSDA